MEDKGALQTVGESKDTLVREIWEEHQSVHPFQYAETQSSIPTQNNVTTETKKDALIA